MQAHQRETWGMLEINAHAMEGKGNNLLVNMDDLGSWRIGRYKDVPMTSSLDSELVISF